MRRVKHRTTSAAAIAHTALTAASVGGLLALAGTPALAQTIDAAPGVSVNLGVLDEMGSPQTLPDLMFPEPRAPRSRLLVPSPNGGAPGETASGRQLQMPTPGAMPQSRLQIAPPPAMAQPSVAQPRPTPTSPPYASDMPPVSTIGAPPMKPISNPPGAHATPPAPVPTSPPPAAPAPPSAPAPATAPATVAQPVPAPTPAAPPPAEPVATPPAAAAPPAATVAPQVSADGLTIPFSSGASALPEAAKADLERLAARLQQNDALQVRVMAYADGDGDAASRARRTSLSRALAVRSFLMDQGVRSTRIEVRALGQPDSGAPDRVDVSILTP